MKFIILRSTFVLTFFLFLAKSDAQTPAIDSLIFEIEEFYDTLDYSAMHTTNFFNRGFLTGSFFEAWKDSIPMIFNISTLDAIRIPFMRTDSSVVIPDKDSLSTFNDIYKLDQQISTIAVPIVFMKGEFIKDTVIKLYVDSGQPLLFEKFNFLCAAPLQDYASQGSVKFRINPNLIFSSGTIISLEVDFDDNQGFQNQNLNLDNINNVEYDSPGDKNLIFRVIDSLGDTTISYSTFNVWSLVSITDGAVYGTVVADSTDSLNYGTRSTPGTSTGMDYLYYAGIDGKRNKPFIFVEGFDVMNTTDAAKSADRFKSYIPNLTNNGYDVYITNFTDGTTNLHTNTIYLKKFIKTVVHKTGTGGFVENHEGAIICVSMGGIITRMALRQLENEGYDHKMGYFITADTPHKGASVAPYLQRAFFDLTKNLPLWILHLKNYYSVIALLNENSNLPTPKKVESAINSPAALQMVGNHNSGTVAQQALQTYLDQLGWPNETRKIALVCGSNQAINHGFSPGDKIFKGNIYLPPSTFFRFWGKSSPTNQSNYRYWEFSKVGTFSWRNRLIRGTKTFGDKPWDSGPGSKLINIKKDWALLKIIPPMMVSPLSAMGVHTASFTGANFYLYDKDNGKGKSYFFSNSLTPFDDVYSINGSFVEPNEVNLKHPVVYEEPIIEDILINQELMVTNFYLQNRTFSKNRDIECAGIMKVGNDVLPFTRQLYDITAHISANTTEVMKTQSTGNVEIPSGKTVNLMAKTSIRFQPGFIAKNGSHFTAKIDPLNPNTRSQNNNIRPCSHIVEIGTMVETRTFMISNDDQNVDWNLKGYNTNLSGSGQYFKVPKNLKKGQYSLYANVPECPISSIVFEVQNPKLIGIPKTELEQFNKRPTIILSPNPANKVFLISSKENILEVEIRDNFGNQLLIGQLEGEKMNTELDISKYASGVYFIRVKLKSGNYETKRLVVQH